MTDYTTSTGSTGTMMIRDTGDWIQFWLKAGSSTYDHSLQWGYDANGGFSGWQTYDFPSGGNWQNVGAVYVTSSQNVTFKLAATGTSGLGGPTDFTQWINRTTVPAPPTLNGPYSLGSSSADFSLTNNSDGGASIADHQIGYGTDPWNVQYLSALSGTGLTFHISGLSSGVTYYFWGRAWNSNGWSNWGNRVQGTTLGVPAAPSTPSMTNVTPISADVNFTPNGNGGSAITGYDVGYGVSSSSPVTVVTATSSPKTISGLTPGTTYFVWVRAKNSIGTGPWSPAKSVKTTVGGYIKVAGVYKIAIPYVRTGGVWKIAQPYVCNGGVWKTTN